MLSGAVSAFCSLTYFKEIFLERVRQSILTHVLYFPVVSNNIFKLKKDKV
jgi:hypothetical protein